jgi:hypothetical protein
MGETTGDGHPGGGIGRASCLFRPSCLSVLPFLPVPPYLTGSGVSAGFAASALIGSSFSRCSN